MSNVNLAPFVTNLDQPIYALKNLPEEVVAVLFAYYSRSPGSLRESLARLVTTDGLRLIATASTDDEADLAKAKEAARSFHEKWVVGYGHSSVAEHAIAHVAIENCSILASKVIEDNRLASYTEKSTRYVWFDPNQYHTPEELTAWPDLQEEYQRTARHLMQTYLTLSERVQEQVRHDWPIQPNQPVKLWESQTKAKACDLCRYLLPACTRTNVGMTLNGRAAEQAIRKLLSHPLAECRRIGEAMKREVLQILPTLVKYAERNEYLADRSGRVGAMVQKVVGHLPAESVNVAEESFEPQVRCLAHPTDAVTDLATAVLFEHAGQDVMRTRQQVEKLSQEDKLTLIEAYLSGRGPHDPPGRALEHINFTFDILVDYGAFRDIQRHRMCTQTDQLLSCAYGYALPVEIKRYGHDRIFREAMQRAQATHTRIMAQGGPLLASYIVPLAFRKRTLFTWNLRELWHFIALRSGKQGHLSYRLVAQACWRELARVCPELARFVPVDMNQYEMGRSGKETVQEMTGA